MSTTNYPQISAFAGFGEFVTLDSNDKFEVVNGPVFFNKSLPNGLKSSIDDINAIEAAFREDRLSTLTVDIATLQEPTATSIGNMPFARPTTPMEGWIDIRGFVRLSILAQLNSAATSANFAVEFKRGSFDKNPQTIVAATPGVVNGDVLLFNDSCEFYSHVRIVVTGAPAAGSDNFGVVNILGK